MQADDWPTSTYPIVPLMRNTFVVEMDIVTHGKLPGVMQDVTAWSETVLVPASSNPPVVIKGNLMVRASTCMGEARGTNVEGILAAGMQVPGVESGTSKFVNLARPKQGGQIEGDDSSLLVTMAKWTPAPLARLQTAPAVLSGADSGVYCYVVGDLVRALMDWPGREQLHQKLRENGTGWKPPELSTNRAELTGGDNFRWTNCIVRIAPFELDTGEGGPLLVAVVTPCLDGSVLHGPQEGDTYFVVHATRLVRTSVVLTSDVYELSLMEVSISHSFDEIQRDP